MLQLFAVVSQLRRQAYIFSRRLRYLPDKIGVNNLKKRFKKQKTSARKHGKPCLGGKGGFNNPYLPQSQSLYLR